MPKMEACSEFALHSSGVNDEERYGYAVAMGGGYAMVGAPLGDRAGSAFIYHFKDGEWVEQQNKRKFGDCRRTV